MEVIIVDLLNIDDDEIHTKFSIYNLGGPALLCVDAREEDLLVTSGFTEDGSYFVMRVGCSYAKWSRTPIVALVHLGLCSQQGLHSLHAIIHGGHVQWSPTATIALIHRLRSSLQNASYHSQVPEA